MKNLERFGSIIAASILIYFTWSALQVPTAKAVAMGKKDDGELPKINRKNLKNRGSDERFVLGDDPFQADWAEAAGIMIAAPTPEPARAEAVVGTVADAAVASAEASDAGKPEYPEPFDLTLESVLAFGGSAQALIAGKTVAVGDTIPGLDPSRPPVLHSIKGSTASVRYRGRTFILDMWARPKITVDLRPTEAKTPTRTTNRGLKPRSGSRR